MEKIAFNLDAYFERVRTGPCFICELVRGNIHFAHHIVHADDEHIAFLNKYPTLPGYCLVAPKAHLKDLASDLNEASYLKLQIVVYRIARALKTVFQAERIYVLSLGSKEGNSHLHWLVAPLPAHVPYEKQQFHALMAEHGVLNIDDEGMAQIAFKVSATLNAQLRAEKAPGH
jgi:diadenosine tetraphosphate (Ap4A) HIT family hydrolase